MPFWCYQVTAAEAKAVVAGLRNPEPLRTSGVHLGGVKYMYLQSDDTQIQAKKGSSGVAIAKSNKCKFQCLIMFIIVTWLYRQQNVSIFEHFPYKQSYRPSSLL